MDNSADTLVRQLNFELDYQRQLTESIIATFSCASALVQENQSLKRELKSYQANEQREEPNERDSEELMQFAAAPAPSVVPINERRTEESYSAGAPLLATSRSVANSVRPNLARSSRRSQFRPRSRSRLFD